MAITNGQTADADDINAELSALASDISALDSAAVKLTGNQTLQGVKTFGSIPVLPASDPTTDNQAVRKASIIVLAVTIVKVGNTTHNASTTGTQNIAHGLGKVPKLVRIRFFGVLDDGGTRLNLGDGLYDGTTQEYSVLKQTTTGDSPEILSGTGKILNMDAGSGGISATIAVDGTNIVLTWSKAQSPTGTVYLNWEAIA